MIFFDKPETHKSVVFSDGKKYFDGFVGADDSVYRETSGTPVKEPDAIYWTEKPKFVSDNEE